MVAASRVGALPVGCLIGLLLFPVACKQSSSTEQTAAQGDGAAGEWIELSKPEARLTHVKVGNREVPAVHWKVHYRFTRGKPSYTYNVTVDFVPRSTIAVKRIVGEETAMEGEFEDDATVLKETPTEIGIEVTGGSIGRNRPASDKVKCAVSR